MKSMFRWGLGLALAAAARVAAGAEAAAPAPEDPATVITSDRLTFDAKQRIALFEYNVLVTDPKMQLAADKLTVQFDEKGQAKTIKAEGRVTITQLDRTAQSELATYDVASGKIVLSGKPRITRGRDVLEGDVITYWRNEDKMICQPGARLLIYPEEGGVKDQFRGE
ncbi:MAG TPA: LptA/OstA family protein [Kiritimatiellia bacterium]|nr:LptA/OstA family protein [Kiritimatiellia bacterium]HRZ11451.1 LptA/OstA family protein [Kiritimatiellia bacterium]HSA16998.1 LptA/OstA family protein [Kiritimatiellia bacterium]